MTQISAEKTIRALVKSNVETYATTFSERHLRELDDPDGTLNMKIHNVFISALCDEIQYYTALVRSLDSSLGNMLERLAINIAELFYQVNRRVEGPLSVKQTQIIAELLEQYKRNAKKPTVKDYQNLRTVSLDKKRPDKRHESDYYLVDPETNAHYLIELKIGGDLDNKKARSEKEAVLEQFAILSNTLPINNVIKIFFATAYNRFGEDKPWNQGRVKQFFADEELLIGKDFWNLICKSKNNYKYNN
ncbi:MAG: TdeIII family type II restriction endonuclease [Bacteroidia bacterium]|nr:TdeIII family type II restriction endonuclease [Bacteroidia bacterium]